MEELVLNQAYVFIIYILGGVLIGVLFDTFRVFRRSFKTPDFLTYIQDALFWLLSGIFILYLIFKFNNGELRGYIFLGIFIGTLIYIVLFSKHFIKVNVSIIRFIKMILVKLIKILLIPVLCLKKLIFKPVSFIFINFRKNIKDFLREIIKFKKMTKLFKKTPK